MHLEGTCRIGDFGWATLSRDEPPEELMGRFKAPAPPSQKEREVEIVLGVAAVVSQSAPVTIQRGTFRR